MTGVRLSSGRTLAFPAGAQRGRGRLCDRDAAAAAEFRHGRFPQGLANSSGLLGRNLMVQSNQAVWGMMERGVPCLQGASIARDHRALELYDEGKDFFGGYCYMSQGPLPVVWAGTQSTSAVSGATRSSMRWSNTTTRSDLKIVGECLPQERNRVTLTDDQGPVRTADCHASPTRAATTISVSSSTRSASCAARSTPSARGRFGMRPTTPVT